MSDTEHLDTNTVPPWLMDAAKPDVNAIGWLVSGYLAGVEVARKAGPCGQQLLVSTPDGPPLLILACDLAHGHRGDHRREWTFMWANSDSALPSLPPVERGPAHDPPPGPS